MVILAELVASHNDIGGYIIYVFKCLEQEINESPYVMMVKYPNWESKPLQIGDTGFVEFIEIRAGIDTWYDKTQRIQVPYNYNSVQFIRFIEKSQDNVKFIM